MNMLTFIREFKLDFSSLMVSLQTFTAATTAVLKKHNTELEELKKWKNDLGMLMRFDCNSAGSLTGDYKIHINGFEHCYFTGELIAEKATNTKKLCVIDKDSKMTQHFFKLGNENDSVEKREHITGGVRYFLFL